MRKAMHLLELQFFNRVCYKETAVLIYLEQQGMVNINWDKINVAYHGVLSTVTNTITNSSTATGGIGESHTAAASLLPTLTDLGIPLTGSMATGFAIGFMKG